MDRPGDRREALDPAGAVFDPGRAVVRMAADSAADCCSWSCRVRAHSFEQKGSPSLTAISGRSLRQFVQRPSPPGGSASSEAARPTSIELSPVSRSARSLFPVEASTNCDLLVHAEPPFPLDGGKGLAGAVVVTQLVIDSAPPTRCR